MKKSFRVTKKIFEELFDNNLQERLTVQKKGSNDILGSLRPTIYGKTVDPYC